MEKLFIYSRVSSDDQTENSPEVQQRIGIEVAKRNDMSYVIKDEGAASSKHENLANRPVMSEILELAKKGKVKHLFVRFINRLSRNDQVSGLIKYVLNKNNVTLYTEDGKYTFNNPSDKLTFEILSAVAEYDNTTRVMAIAPGIDLAISKGIYPGTTPYGYKRVNKKLVVNEEEAQVVRRIFELCIAGLGQKAIATLMHNEKVPTKADILTKKYNEENKELIEEVYAKKAAGQDLTYHDKLVIKRATRSSTWASGIVHTIYSNRIYIGEYAYRGKINKNAPAIVTVKTFTDAEKARKSHSKSWDSKEQSRFAMLKGMMHCTCGFLIGVITREHFSNYYLCGSRRVKYQGKYCGLPNVNQKDIDSLVWNAFIDSGNLFLKIYSDTQKNGRDIVTERRKLQDKITTAEKKIKLLNDKFERAELKYLDEEVSQISYLRQKDNFQSQIEELNSDIEKFTIELEDASTDEETPMTNFIKSIRKIQKVTDPAEKRKILQKYVEDIILSHDGKRHQVELHMKYNKYIDGYWLKERAVIRSQDYLRTEEEKQEALSKAMYEK